MGICSLSPVTREQLREDRSAQASQCPAEHPAVLSPHHQPSRGHTAISGSSTRAVPSMDAHPAHPEAGPFCAAACRLYFSSSCSFSAARQRGRHRPRRRDAANRAAATRAGGSCGTGTGWGRAVRLNRRTAIPAAPSRLPKETRRLTLRPARGRTWSSTGLRQRLGGGCGRAVTGGTHQQRGLKCGRPTARGRTERGRAEPGRPSSAHTSPRAGLGPALLSPGGSGGCPERGGSAGACGGAGTRQAVPVLPHPSPSCRTPSPRRASDPMFPPATGGSERANGPIATSPLLGPGDSLCLSQLFQRCIFFFPMLFTESGS